MDEALASEVSPETSGEDQPDIDLTPHDSLAGGVPEGMTGKDVEGRSELASYLGRVWPATREELVEIARDNNAPEGVLFELDQLPEGHVFGNLQDVWTALSGGAVEQSRF